MRIRRALGRGLRFGLALVALAGCGCGTGGDPGPTAAPSSTAASAAGTAPAATVATAVPATTASPTPPGPCALRPACDAPLPPLGAPRPLRHRRSSAVMGMGPPQHRGRDLLLVPGAPQWILAKLAYGPSDKDLADEDIDVYLLRGCGATWEKVGTYRTTPGEKSHPPVLGVPDQGGQLFLELSKVTRPLDVGRHRVRLVVAGDLTATDLFIEVLPPGAQVSVSDIDGTLTSSEVAVATDAARGEETTAHPGAADVMHALATRGHHIFYLTARPDWLTDRTRTWLALRGFPPGILHTTVTSTGLFGKGAAAFKAAELAALKDATALIPTYAFGNMPSDVATYGAASIPPSRCYYFRLDGDLRGGVRHVDYRDLLPTFTALPARCP